MLGFCFWEVGPNLLLEHDTWTRKHPGETSVPITVDFHGKTEKAVEGNSLERGNKTQSLFLPLNSYFSFFF